jgi:hypothetical protein
MELITPSGSLWLPGGALDRNELLAHPHQFEGSREFADTGVPRGSHRAGQAFALPARYAHDELYWQAPYFSSCGW